MQELTQDQNNPVRCDGTNKAAGCFPRDHSHLYHQEPQLYTTLAEASNGSVVRTYIHLESRKTEADIRPQAVIDPSGAVRQFSSLDKVLSGAPGQAFSDLQSCSQVAAYATGFAALTSAGSVYTWGDERYEACLGRELTGDEQADKPGLVTALQHLPTGPISKIAAGGYMLAALTTGNDLYLWGGHPGRKTVPVDVTEEPAPVVIHDYDVTDVAVGESHLIVLTAEGKVFVIGDNGNGQLGLPAESLETWTLVELNLRPGRKVIGVAAGPRNSFVTVTTD